jgi:hypothetical protein
MAFGENHLKEFSGFQGLRDYTHAAKTFRTNSYELTPKYKFLFHVYFNINTGQIPFLQSVFGNGAITSIGLSVKTIQLPSYTMSVDTMNQYNRKRLVQSKIEYNPVQVVFNDDQGDNIRNMWYCYYSYYYKDPTQKYEGQPVTNGSIGKLQTLANGFGYNTRDIYNTSRQVSDWGYVGEAYQDSSVFTGASPGGKPPFFNDIKIYGLNQKKYASYVLINPLITDWQGDTYDYAADGGTMINTMTIKYETVKYYAGAVGGTTPSTSVSGFADPAHYDTTLSPIARRGSEFGVNGQGGTIPAGAGSIQDMQIGSAGRGGLATTIGGVQQPNANNQIRRPPSVFDDNTNSSASSVYRQALPSQVRQVVNGSSGMIFPLPPTQKTQ